MELYEKNGNAIYILNVLKKYSDEIRECREIFKDKLIIRAGIEICEPHENKEELKVVLENIPFDFIFNFILCVWVFCLHVCLCIVCIQCPWKPEEGVRSPGTITHCEP